MRFTTKSAEETQALAKKLLPELLQARIVCLKGDLGAGKTTFVKGIARALGVEEVVKSPTYTYVNIYSVPLKIKKPRNEGVILSLPKESGSEGASSSFPRFLIHYDLYRLPENVENPQLVAAEIGLEEALENPAALVVIEWAERLRMSEEALLISFETQGKKRIMTIFEA